MGRLGSQLPAVRRGLRGRRPPTPSPQRWASLPTRSTGSQNTEFALAFQPGTKAFDWHMAQISIRPGARRGDRLQRPYFDANQSLIAMSANDIVEATTHRGTQGHRTSVPRSRTTSLQLIENVIQPDNEPQVFDDNAAGCPGPAERPDRRARRRPLHRLLHTRRAARGLGHAGPGRPPSWASSAPMPRSTRWAWCSRRTAR